MITATFKWLTTGTTGSILEWQKPGMHLTPYHLHVIKNHGFMEFEPEQNEIVCFIEVNNKLIAKYRFLKLEHGILVSLTDIKTYKTIINYYRLERIMK